MTFFLMFRYCGPGTDIEKSDDAGGPINLLGTDSKNSLVKSFKRMSFSYL